MIAAPSVPAHAVGVGGGDAVLVQPIQIAGVASCIPIPAFKYLSTITSARVVVAILRCKWRTVDKRERVAYNMSYNSPL